MIVFRRNFTYDIELSILTNQTLSKHNPYVDEKYFKDFVLTLKSDFENNLKIIAHSK